MLKLHYSWTAGLVLCSLVFIGFPLLHGTRAQSQYPMADMIAANIVQKYQNSTCEQLWQKKMEHAPPRMEEQRAIEILRNDPQMRAEFINKIAAPIANKMFECGMIP